MHFFPSCFPKVAFQPHKSNNFSFKLTNRKDHHIHHHIQTIKMASSCCPVCYKVGGSGGRGSPGDFGGGGGHDPVPGENGGTTTVGGVQQRFFKLIQSWLTEGGVDWDGGQQQFPLEQLEEFGMICCGECSKIMEGVCDRHHQLKTAQLSLNRKLEKLKRIMTEAQGSSTRLGEHVKKLAGTEAWRKGAVRVYDRWFSYRILQPGGPDMMGAVLESRESLIAICSGKVTCSFPKLDIPRSEFREEASSVSGTQRKHVGGAAVDLPVGTGTEDEDRDLEEPPPVKRRRCDTPRPRTGPPNIISSSSPPSLPTPPPVVAKTEVVDPDLDEGEDVDIDISPVFQARTKIEPDEEQVQMEDYPGLDSDSLQMDYSILQEPKSEAGSMSPIDWVDDDNSTGAGAQSDLQEGNDLENENLNVEQVASSSGKTGTLSTSTRSGSSLLGLDPELQEILKSHRRAPNSYCPIMKRTQFNCICGASSTFKQLQVHLRNMLFVKPYKCQVPGCDVAYSYRRFNCLMIHSNDKHGIKITAADAGCFMCGEQFGSEDETRAHEEDCPKNAWLRAAMKLPGRDQLHSCACSV